MKAEDKKLFDKICSWIEEGNSLRWCLRQPGTVSRNTFYKWLDADEKLANQYARATSRRAENIFEDIMLIADSQEGDVIKVDGVDKVNHDNIQRARLRVDARKWMLAKMIPKKYGEKLEVDQTVKKEFTPPILENGKPLPGDGDDPEFDELLM